jgi:hypothetical protein
LVKRSRAAPMRQRDAVLSAYRYSYRTTCHVAEATRRLSCGCAHSKVQPAQGPPTSTRLLGNSRGVRCPFGASAQASPLHPGLPHRVRCHPQGFTPSRQLAPRLSARPCFMPETPMGFRSPGIFPRNQVRTASTAGIPSRRFSPTFASGVAARQPGRPVRADLSTGGPNLWSPSGLCSGCESVPREDCYVAGPTADSLLSLVASPGSCPPMMAALRVTRSLMRFVVSTARVPSSKLVGPRRKAGCASAN